MTASHDGNKLLTCKTFCKVISIHSLVLKYHVFQGKRFFYVYDLTSSDKLVRSEPQGSLSDYTENSYQPLLNTGRTPKFSVSGNLGNTWSVFYTCSCTGG